MDAETFQVWGVAHAQPFVNGYGGLAPGITCAFLQNTQRHLQIFSAVGGWREKLIEEASACATVFRDAMSDFCDATFHFLRRVSVISMCRSYELRRYRRKRPLFRDAKRRKYIMYVALDD